MTVHDGPGDMILAGVAHNNPNYDPGWVPFFAALVVLAGCLIVLVGGAMSIGMRDLVGRRKWAGYTIGPTIITIGIAVVALGVWLW
ncbi:hypothetical protein ACFYZJ_31075 [Streptomyces sp. NPDC001848]|uniref:hypothetical protein n=1 Tax=Streptomyces sp. NPDC001848 TaxID=3364618 RepID=UPI0036938D01